MVIIEPFSHRCEVALGLESEMDVRATHIHHIAVLAILCYWNDIRR
jgi:hypothetical protein